MVCLYDLPKAQYESIRQHTAQMGLPQVFCNCHRCSMQSYRVASKQSDEYDNEPNFMQKAFYDWFSDLLAQPGPASETKYDASLWKQQYDNPSLSE